MAERLRSALVTCARCHGARGEGGGKGAFPRLAGQSQPYLAAALRAYASGSRPSGIMQPIARELDEKTIGEIAAGERKCLWNFATAEASAIGRRNNCSRKSPA